VNRVRAVGDGGYMMKAVSTSETSVYIYETTRLIILQVCRLHTRCRENLKSHRVSDYWLLKRLLQYA
jgi:hypothetical protein